MIRASLSILFEIRADYKQEISSGLSNGVKRSLQKRKQLRELRSRWGRNTLALYDFALEKSNHIVVRNDEILVDDQFLDFFNELLRNATQSLDALIAMEEKTQGESESKLKELKRTLD